MKMNTDNIYSGMQKFGHSWSKFMFEWTVKQVEDEMISKKHKVPDHTLPLHFELNIFFIFIFNIFKMTEKEGARKVWAPCIVST